MNENKAVSAVSVCIFMSITVICWACVRGCDRVYNPDTIRADAESRVKLHDAFKHE